MTATNKTTIYKLPIFVPTDKPTWLGDFNGAMNSIEAGLVDAKNSSTTAIQTANTALNIANQAETNATEAKTSANGATTTANNANNKADNAISVANEASASATQALTTVNGINTYPPAIFGVARATNDNVAMPDAPAVFAMTPVTQYGMTWMPASNGYRVNRAGVYLVNVEASVKPSENEGAIWITRNRAGTITNLRYSTCPRSEDDYSVDVTSILALNGGDIITVSGDNALFYGGADSLNGIELTIARLGS